jgi:hypothetical protein
VPRPPSRRRGRRARRGRLLAPSTRPLPRRGKAGWPEEANGRSSPDLLRIHPHAVVMYRCSIDLGGVARSPPTHPHRATRDSRGVLARLQLPASAHLPCRPRRRVQGAWRPAYNSARCRRVGCAPVYGHRLGMQVAVGSACSRRRSGRSRATAPRMYKGSHAGEKQGRVTG